jgi:hypothetical protein
MIKAKYRECKAFCFANKKDWQFFALPAIGASRHDDRVTVGFVSLLGQVFIQAVRQGVSEMQRR